MLIPKYSDFAIEAGTDEAGRGCLAGPVTAAAVILPDSFCCELLNDSKKLSKKQRDYLRKLIEDKALSFKVCHISEDVIDQINILNAAIRAMHNCILGLNPKPHFVIVDGNRFHPIEGIKHQTIVKGDGKYLSIAAASVLAKTYRDEYMSNLHQQYPMYDWNNNKGYPTVKHRTAIQEFGTTIHHRKSFTLLPTQLQIDF
ncbi:MAG: ribonuclease HII [Bacteroidota bacterium]|nr:ribonuclease HII [Bacteroidota bacterium]